MTSRFRFSATLILALALILSLTFSQKTLADTGTSLTTSPITLGLNVHPGATTTQTLEVMNNGTTALPMVMKVQTFGAYGEAGEAAITDFQPNDPALGYIHLSPTSFTAQPGVWSKVKATITLPKTALLGYYYAVIFQPVTPTQTLAPKTTAVKGSNAILLLVDTGSANEQRTVQISNFTVSKSLYEYLPATFSVTVHNSGNIFLNPRGDIFISKSSSGTHTLDTLPINAGSGNVLPNSNRIFQATWSDGFPVFKPVVKNGVAVTNKKGVPVEHLDWNFANTNKLRFGKYYAQLALAYNNGSHEVLLNSTISFWVIPWKILLVVIVFALLLLFAFWSLGRSIYRRIRGTRKKTRRPPTPPAPPAPPATPTAPRITQPPIRRIQ